MAPFIVKELLRKAVRKRKDILIMSVGGVLGNEKLLDAAAKKGIRVIMPSGAISGIDALKAAKKTGIESVTITTRKPPKSLSNIKYLTDKGVDVSAVSGETVLFEGNVTDAVKAFPKNINVSALLALAGIGPEKTKVKIVTSPEYTRNVHEIEIRGSAGTVLTRTENVPSEKNPGTSYLAVLSAKSALDQYFSTVQIGS